MSTVRTAKLAPHGLRVDLLALVTKSGGRRAITFNCCSSVRLLIRAPEMLVRRFPSSGMPLAFPNGSTASSFREGLLARHLQKRLC